MKTRIMSLGVVAIAVACTGGQGGEGLPFPAPRDPPPSGREPVDPGRDNAGPARDTPSPERDTPGEPITGGTGACIKCDMSYRCAIVENGKTQEETLDLKTTDGQCVEDKKNVFRCDGQVVSTDDGTVVGTWHSTGNGGFTAAAGQITVSCLPMLSAAPQGGGDAQANR